MKNIFLSVILIIIIFLTVSCCGKQKPDPEVISELLTLDYEKGPEIQFGGIVEVWIENNSTECVVFPTDYGIKIYHESNGIKSEINRKGLYLGNGLNYLRKKGDKDSIGFITISPDLTNFSIVEPVDLTALITGHLCDDETVIITKEIPIVVVP